MITTTIALLGIWILQHSSQFPDITSTELKYTVRYGSDAGGKFHLVNRTIKDLLDDPDFGPSLRDFRFLVLKAQAEFPNDLIFQHPESPMLGIGLIDFRYNTSSASKSIIIFKFQDISMTAGWMPGIGFNQLSFTQNSGAIFGRPTVRFSVEESQSRLRRLAEVLGMSESLMDLKWTPDSTAADNAYFTLINTIPGSSCSNGMGITGNFSLHLGFPSTSGVRTIPVDYEPLVGLAQNTDQLRSSAVQSYLRKSEDQGFEILDGIQSLAYLSSPTEDFPHSARHARIKEQKKALITQAFDIVPAGTRGENGELTMIVTFIVDVQTGEVLRAAANYAGVKAAGKKTSLDHSKSVQLGTDGDSFRIVAVEASGALPERRVALRQGNHYFAARLDVDRRLVVVDGKWFRIPHWVQIPE